MPPDVEHKERLAGVHPELADKALTILGVMSVLDAPMFVTEGVRSTARQQALFAQGRTTPGKIVTNVDGVKVRGKHQIDRRDGLGHAVDFAFRASARSDDPWSTSHPWRLFGEVVKVLGLVWGGEFTTIRGGDGPHAELPFKESDQ